MSSWTVAHESCPADRPPADAGSPVRRAKVTFLGVTRTTGAKGTVAFTVGAGVPSGKKPMTARKPGFAQGHAVVRVT